MLQVALAYISVVLSILVFTMVLVIPGTFSINRYTKSFDLMAIVGTEFNICKSQTAISMLFPSSTIYTKTNITYRIDPTTNVFYVNGSQVSLMDSDALSKILPILLLIDGS